MSANVMEEDHRMAAQAGMDDYIPKPIPMPLLATALKHCKRQDDETLSNSGLFDERPLTALRESVGDAGLRDVIETYLRDTETLMETLRAAVRCDDVKKTMTTAHQLKAANATIGATKLAQNYAEIESIAGSSEQGGLFSALKNTEPLFESVRARLRRRLDAA
jgi:CheY-like chemotaxis protein